MVRLQYRLDILLKSSFFFSHKTVDEKFNEEEKRFRAIEKLIKTILKNINQFVEDFKVSFVNP